jgi:hypothetical protein
LCNFGQAAAGLLLAFAELHGLIRAAQSGSRAVMGGDDALEAVMQLYRSYHIYTTAVRANGAWHGRAIILNAEANVSRQLKRLETLPKLLFITRGEAEAFTLRLCKDWVNAQGGRRTETAAGYGTGSGGPKRAFARPKKRATLASEIV